MRQEIKRNKLYVGGALTNAPQEFRDNIAWIQDEMESRGWQVLRFLGLGGAERGEVLETDIGNVTACHKMIAICDHDSTGLGMELQHAVSMGRRILALAAAGGKVTRMVTDLPYMCPNADFRRYDTFEDIPDIAEKVFARPAQTEPIEKFI